MSLDRCGKEELPRSGWHWEGQRGTGQERTFETGEHGKFASGKGQVSLPLDWGKVLRSRRGEWGGVQGKGGGTSIALGRVGWGIIESSLGRRHVSRAGPGLG